MAPVEDENVFPLTRLSNQGRGKKYCFFYREAKKKELVPSPLMGEGQDEGEKPE